MADFASTLAVLGGVGAVGAVAASNACAVAAYERSRIRNSTSQSLSFALTPCASCISWPLK